MPSSISLAGGWSDHRLRAIVADAYSLSSILEDPGRSLIAEHNRKQFLDAVCHLGDWLAPCEHWSADDTQRPPGMDAALLHALFALWSELSRLGLTSFLEAVEDSSLGVQLLIRCPKSMTKPFREAAAYLRDLVRQQATAARAITPEAHQRLIIDRETNVLTLDGTPYGPLPPDAVRIVEQLYQEPGKLITGKKLGNGNEKRTRDLIHNLPEPIHACVKAKPGGGYWFELPPAK